MQDFFEAPRPSPRLASRLAATVPGRPRAKAPIPPAWRSWRRETTVDGCRLSLSERLIAASPESECCSQRGITGVEHDRTFAVEHDLVNPLRQTAKRVAMNRPICKAERTRANCDSVVRQRVVVT